MEAKPIVSWSEMLREENKGIFSSLISYEKASTQINTFYYQNESDQQERVVAILLDVEGKIVGGYEPMTATVAPSETFKFEANKVLEKLQLEQFIGSILLIIRPQMGKPFATGAKDFLSVWKSGEAYCQIGIAMFFNVNTPERKPKSSYYMYCPSVELTQSTKSIVVIYNTATDAGYEDVVECTPILSNEKGEQLTGPTSKINPFGMLVIDSSKYFGEEGVALLSKTSGRGTLSVAHRGHLMSSMFFKVRKNDGIILSGSHTQPPILGVTPAPGTYWLRLAAEKIPFLYLGIKLRHLARRIIKK